MDTVLDTSRQVSLAVRFYTSYGFLQGPLLNHSHFRIDPRTIMFDAGEQDDRRKTRYRGVHVNCNWVGF